MDYGYLCRLGPGALPAILEFEVAQGTRQCATYPSFSAPASWREWGFREWRLARKLAALGPRHLP